MRYLDEMSRALLRTASRLSTILGWIVAAAAAPARADSPPPVHWAYGPYFGTGYYSSLDGDDTFVVRMRPGWRWRDAELGEHGRKLGLRFRLPIALGLQRPRRATLAETVAETLDRDHVSTLSIVPGAEIEVPIGPQWSLKPFAYVGYGKRFDGDAAAWIYWSGIKSRVSFGGDDFAWALVNGLTYVGYSSDSREHGSALPLLTAFEFSTPLAKKIGGHGVRLHWHVAYTDYLNPLVYSDGIDTRRLELIDEWEVGAAFSTGEQPLKLWRLKWDQLGLAYRVSSDREFRGVRLTFSSLFDR